MKYITGDEWLGVKGYWFMVIGLMLIAGCSSDSSDEQQTNNQILHIKAYTAPYQDIEASRRAAPTGFTVYVPTTDFSVGLFVMSSETPTPSVQYIRRSNNTWHSSILVKSAVDYEIYGFMPRFEGMTPTISKTDGIVTMTLPNIDAVSAQDVCVITGVSDASANTVEGSFAFTGRSDVNNINVLMDHLYAAVSFNFSVNENFNNLRKIKLKKMELQATNTKGTATVTLTPNTTGASPVTDVSYTTTTSGTEKAIATFFESEAGVQLPTADIKNSFCYYAPTLSNDGNLTLLSTYDVYDRTGTKLIRKDCTATNKVPNLYTSRGERVTVNLTVNPTYLYQLSDADLDNLFTIE